MVEEIVVNMKEGNERITRILEILLEYVHKDFTHTIPVSDKGDELDALAVGLNAMAEELQSSINQSNALKEEFMASSEELLSGNEELSVINEHLEAANRTIATQKDEQLNRVLDSSNDVIWSFDLTGDGENYLSRSAERIYGEPLYKLIQRPQFWLEHLHPDDRTIKEASQRRLELEGFTECTYRIMISGGTLWIHDRLKLIRGEHGNPERLEGIATDVTFIKEAQHELDKERMLLRSLIDNIPDYIFVKDDQFRHIINNKAKIKLLGATNEMETLWKTTEDYHGKEGTGFLEDDKFVFSSGQAIINKEETLPVANGSITVLTTKIPLKDENGKVTAMIGISRDITELKKQEQVLNEYRENLDIIFSNSSGSFILLDADANVVLFNQAFENFIFDVAGIKAKVGMKFSEVVDPLRKEVALPRFNRALKGEEITDEVEFTSRSGKKIIHLLHYEPTRRNGNVTHVSISMVDITTRKDKENLLLESEANLKSILGATPDGFLLLNKEYQVVMMNEGYRNMVKNVSGQDIKTGSSILDLVPAERDESFRLMLDQVAAKEVVQYESGLENGSKGWFNVTITPVMTGQDEFIGYCVSAHDVTPQKQAENSIRASEERFRALVENSVDLSLISDFDGNVLFASSNLTRILGYENLVTGYIGLIHPDDMALSSERLDMLMQNPGKPIPSTIRIKHKDGSWRWMEGVSTNLVDLESIKGIVSTYRDVTVRKGIEGELARNQFFLEKATEAAKIGYWSFEPNEVNGNLIWSKEVFKIYNVDEKDFDGKYETFLRFVHPDDRDRVIGLAQLALFYNMDHRIVLKNGEVRWVNERAQVIRNEKNEVVRIVGIVQDITEQKTTEGVLREYNDRYEILSKATNDVIWDWDMVRDRVLYNHAMKTVLGYDDYEIKSTGAWRDDRFHPEDRERAMNEMEEIFKKHLPTWDSVYRYRTAGGDYKHIHDRAYVVYNADGKPIRMIGTMGDVTEQTLSLDEIKKLSLVASKTDNSVIITDSQGGIEWVNDGFTRLTGYTLKEVKGRQTEKFMEGPDTDLNVANRMREKLKRLEPVTEELINYSKTGHRFWLRHSITPVLDEAHQLKNFITIQTDISEQKEYERSITLIAHELSSLIENANVPIFGVTETGRIIEWNRVCKELTGYSQEEVFETNLLEKIIVPESWNRFNEMITNVLTGVPVSNFEIPIISKSKNRIILLMSASIGRGGKGEARSVIIVAQNITELSEYRLGLEKKVEERTHDLNLALQKEKILVGMKSKFVSIASHEFRTPLSSISLASGFIRKYKQRMTPEDVDRKLQNIETQVHHMSYLLDDVLVVGKSEAGGLKVNWSTLSTRNLFKGLIEEVMQSANDSHTIDVKMDCKRESFLGDEKLMRSIVINLLTNAIKFSPGKNEVELKVSCDEKEMVILVRDQGMGIPPEDVGNLFESFYRGGNATTIAGTGLGLSIVKKALDLLGGEVKVKSELGKGTEFTVRFPLKNG